MGNHQEAKTIIFSRRWLRRCNSHFHRGDPCTPRRESWYLYQDDEEQEARRGDTLQQSPHRQPNIPRSAGRVVLLHVLEQCEAVSRWATKRIIFHPTYKSTCKTIGPKCSSFFQSHFGQLNLQYKQKWLIYLPSRQHYLFQYATYQHLERWLRMLNIRDNGVP